jgi:hypothetical protein
MNTDKLRLLAKDLTKEFPRSPRETLAGYVVAGRTLDKCRAFVNASIGEFLFNCPLDQRWFEFSEIDPEAFKDFVATGATDAEVAEWITKHAKPRERIEIIKWNNRLRDMRISELPDQAQEFLEDYIPKWIPKNRPAYTWFDLYDLEEERI